MKAAVFYGPRDLRLEEREIPKPREGEIVVKVGVSGLCPTDAKVFKFGSSSVKPPVVLGHEFTGTVHALGPNVKSLVEGERVSVPADAFCGRCEMCISGKENLCLDPLAFGYQVDGAHADYLVIPRRFIDRGGILKLPEENGLEAMSMTEPVACTLHNITSMKIGPSKKLLVVGDGPMGLLHVIVAKAYGCNEIIVSGLIDWKLKLAKELGATDTINSGQYPDLQSEVKKIAPRGVDASALTVVTNQTVPQAINSTAKGGYVSIFAGVPSGSVTNALDPNWIHYNEVTLIGSSGYTYSEFRTAFEIARVNESSLEKLVSHRFTLERIHEAMKVWDDKEASLKIEITR